MCIDLAKNKYDEIFVFSSDFHNISYADEIIEKISNKVKISQEIYGNILLSLSEAINNAIVHGNKFDNDKSVTVSCTATEHKIELSVKDEGEGFDYRKINDPTSAEFIEKLSGRGVFIIIKLADIVEFSYEDGQIVKIIFYLS